MSSYLTIARRAEAEVGAETRVAGDRWVDSLDA